MTKTLKWLGGGIAAAMLLGLAGLFSGELAEAQDAPSGAPHRFEGTVTLDGEGVAAGTSITAIVDGAECGSDAVSLTNASGSVYVLDVPASCAEAGDTVHFKVGGYDAAETGTWNGTYSEVNLTATSMMEDPEDPMDDCPDDMNGMGDEDMGEGEGDGPAEPDLGMNGDDGDMNGDDGDMNGDGGDMDDCPDDGDMDDTDMDDMDMDDTDMDDTDMDDTDMDDTDMDMDPDPGKTGTGIASTSTSTSLAAILGMMALAIALGGYTYARRRS